MDKVQEAVSFEESCLKEEPIPAWDPIPLLRGVAKMVRQQHYAKPTFEGDYKDSIAEQSDMMFEVLNNWAWNAKTSAERRSYKRVLGEAYRLGLLYGHECPRATIAAWSSLIRGEV